MGGIGDRTVKRILNLRMCEFHGRFFRRYTRGLLPQSSTFRLLIAVRTAWTARHLAWIFRLVD